MRILSIILILASLPSIAQKRLIYEDKTYESQIRSVQCYPNQQNAESSILPAVTSLGTQNLLLEFDDLQGEQHNYYVKLIHCNFDWTKSTLMDMDFMREYNENIINDYTFSLNTHIPYVHYRFPIPPVKIPGNYLVIVYRDGKRDDLILSRRISVFEQRFSLTQDNGLAGIGNIRNTNQALNFVVNYGRTEVINPLGSIHVAIRQNHRWDNAKADIKPSFVREDRSELEYRFFDMDKTFQGGNEFRFVDFRSLNYPGQNTLRLDKSHKPYELFVAIDGTRENESYSQYPDMNGNFAPDNRDYEQEPWISANYLYVTFGLKSPKLTNDVYVIGAFNGWQRNEENKMEYNSVLSMYTKRILLKQGFYNYQYYVDSGTPNQLEGNHFQTENIYDVFVYYRGFQPNADLLVGYFVMPVNPR